MAKSKYETHVQNKLPLIESWARDGFTDEQIAKMLGISKDTFYEYKKKYPDFSDSLKKAKEVIDVQVENALLKKAMGYTVELKKTYKVKQTKFDSASGKKLEEKESIRVGYNEVYVPPDTTAQIFWLKNRRPGQWKANKETARKPMNIKKDENGRKTGTCSVCGQEVSNSDAYCNTCGYAQDWEV